MARNPMQDIVPKNKSIRDIPLPESRRSASKREERNASPKVEIEEATRETRRETEEEKEVLRLVQEEFSERGGSDDGSQPRRRSFKALISAAVIIIVIILAIMASTIFHSATLTVTPRTFAASVKADLIGKKAAVSPDLHFTVISVTQTASQTVTASGEKQVDTRATGTIVVYNNYSATSQRLVKNTRFATPEGLIFRISDSVTVPGKKGTTPGSIEAVVLADVSGTTYNVGLKDFTIPGFKGDPRYDGFYGRSKTPLAGGFSGKVKVIAPDDLAKAKITIEYKLKEALIKAEQEKQPDGVSTIASEDPIIYKELPQEPVSDSQVIVKEEGTLSIAIFDDKALSSAVAKATIKDYKGEPIIISNLNSLYFTPKKGLDPTADTISFSVSGNATFEWLYDEAALKKALLNQPRSDIPAVLQKFPMIQKADISIRPFWSGSFPASTDKITIKKVI